MREIAARQVSVIVPVFNGKKYVGRCVRALVEQTHPYVQIIIVDDGSTDETAELVKPPALLVRTGGREGAGAARNRGAAAATGEVLFFTDVDCIVPPTWIEHGLRTMAERGVSCAGGGYAGPVGQGFIQRFAYEEQSYRRRHFSGYVSTLVSNNMYCMAELFRERGGFPEDYKAASSEDMVFSWNLSRTHLIWWADDNGVYHDYADNLSAYLKQQYRFARDAVPMFLRTSKLLTAQTHHGKQLYFETGATALFVASFLLQQPVVMLACMVSVLVINAGFIPFLVRRVGCMRTILSVGMIYLRNLAIVAGGIGGACRLLMRK